MPRFCRWVISYPTGTHWIVKIQPETIITSIPNIKFHTDHLFIFAYPYKTHEFISIRTVTNSSILPKWQIQFLLSSHPIQFSASANYQHCPVQHSTDNRTRLLFKYFLCENFHRLRIHTCVAPNNSIVSQPDRETLWDSQKDACAWKTLGSHHRYALELLSLHLVCHRK